VVDAAVGVFLEESGDGRLLAERQQQLDLGILQLDEDNGDTVLGKVLRVTNISERYF